MRVFVTLLVLAPLCLAPPALAQAPDDCALGTASADLAFGDVRARLFNKGNLFWDGGDPYYEVPKGDGISAIFAAGIWVGGIVDGEIRIAAATYAQGGEDYEFYPGPLDAAGNPPEDCTVYDTIWTVNVREVEHYEATGEASPALLAWPVDLGAPVIDGDGIPENYDLEAGDRPEIYGHETAFWVMNDAAGPHLTTLSEPLKMEVRVTAFSVAGTDPAYKAATFYRYELDYRGGTPLEDAYFTFWTDPDLGDFEDDYVGTDTTRGMAYVYNSDNDDNAGSGGYGEDPPALGYDFLSGAGHTMWYASDINPRSGNPDTFGDFYNYMQSQWKDGTSLTHGGDGLDPDGTPTDFLFPGDPVEPTYWTERCPTPDCAAPLSSGDRRLLISAPSFELQPGETQTVDFAILWARGEDHLDSITELRAVSDAVQARYDAGNLFAPFEAPLALDAPVLLGPADGAEVFSEPVTFSWEPVPGADRYILEAQVPDGNTYVYLSESTSTTVALPIPENTVTDVTWRVRAESENAVGLYSAYRTLSYYQFVGGVLGNGAGIVETVHPSGAVCPDEGDPGCGTYGGNTVWLSANSTDDYVLTSPNGELASIIQEDIIGSDDFELRFTEGCATPGNCLGAYMRNEGEIVSVPFELWNIRSPQDASDDVRMPPLIRTLSGTDPLVDFAGAFPGSQEVVVDGQTTNLDISHRVFWLMPDRPNGYELFEAAANGFGGPGAIYDRENDGDDQIDPTTDGDACSQQGYYVDFCYLSVPPYRAPIGGGGSAGMLIADLAGDGTMPPAGTTVRFQTFNELVDTESDGARPSAVHLAPAYPNPLRAEATVTYDLDAASNVRLAVYDVLGRQVAVLADGPRAVGRHRATFDGRSVASGVYLVVLEARGERRTQKLLLVK